jgi:predicted ATPase
MSAKALALRPPISLARMFKADIADARDLLAPLYSSFTEGFDTADLKDVRVMLDELH